MSTLYRQYRPQQFADIFGQPHIVETLSAALEQDRISHAFLFQGPRGTGKTSTARILAKRLNCTTPKGAEPCNTCEMCIATRDGKNIDVIEIDAASNRGIDNIRSLRENTSLSPVMGKYKVYIIDEVHMLSHDAFPALLKTLEEPVPHVVFILATTELHKVPPTILSRCQVYRFRRATEKEMRERLTFLLTQEKRQADDAILDFIISRADGCYRDAESLLGQLLSLKDNKLTAENLPQLLGLPSPTLVADFLQALVTKNLAAALPHIDTVYTTGIDPEQFLQECIRTARDAIVRVATQHAEIPTFARQPGAVSSLTSAIRTFVQAIQDLAYVPQPNIALQLAAMTLCAGAVVPAKPAAPPAATAYIPTLAPKRTVTPAAATSVSISAPVTNPAPATPSVPAVVALSVILEAWPQLIAQIKKNNPVASTFLRAVEPFEVQGNILMVRVSYPLHRTFFEKPDNKALVENILLELTQAKVSIRCQMETAGVGIPSKIQQFAPPSSFSQPAPSTPKSSEPAGNDAVYNAVKEVFGSN